MPLAYLLRVWRKLGRYAEASSEGELHLALRCGFSPARIIVSGPGKLAWLRSLQLRELTVLLDSVAEATSFAAHARRSGWRLGLRFAPPQQVDPDNPEYPDQFGVDRNDWHAAIATLHAGGLKVSVLQFHLGGWSGDVDIRLHALRELAALADSEKLQPDVIDIGGGFQQAYRAEHALRTARSVDRARR